MEAESPCVEYIYQRMVQLTARAFYSVEMKTLFKEDDPPDTLPAPKGRGSKKQPADFTGLGVVVMDALLNRPWWEEEDFARRLQLPMRPVRQVLRLLETHFLVAREHRKEKRRKAKGADDEPEPVVEGDEVDEGSQERGHLISYCSLDYQRLFDMARFRMFKIRQTLKSELEDRRAIQEYTCPSCSRMYTTLHAAVLIKSDGLFHCEECDSVLEAGGAEGQGDKLNRRERTKLVKAKQAKLEQELLPLSTVLVEIEKKIASGDCIPDFGTLTAWAAGEAEKLGSPAARRAGRRPNTAEISIKMEGGEVREAERAELAPRELPPWLQRKDQAPIASTSYSVSQEMSEDTKDFTDIKSLGPEDSKAAVEAEYMRQYKERMANIAVQEAQPNAKRQRTEGGWEEVSVKTEGQWQEVPSVKEDDEWEDAEAAVQDTPGQQAPVNATPASQEPPDEDGDWEDA